MHYLMYKTLTANKPIFINRESTKCLGVMQKDPYSKIYFYILVLFNLNSDVGLVIIGKDSYSKIFVYNLWLIITRMQ